MIIRQKTETGKALYIMYFKQILLLQILVPIKVPVLKLLIKVLGFMKNLVGLENYISPGPSITQHLSPPKSLER